MPGLLVIVATALLLSPKPLVFDLGGAPELQSPPPRVAALEYSDAYRIRQKIHKIASFATLPLFATEFALGQSIYNTPNEGRRSAHAAVGASIGALFAVNTVTGAWNLWDARKDSNGRKRRLLHGILMMAADAGFVATAALAPETEDDNWWVDYKDRKSLHRTVALTSIGIATAGYLTMLFGGH